MSTNLSFKKICDDFGLTEIGVRHALEQYQIIITELTHGFFSKLTYDAPVILNKARECFEKEYSNMEPVRHARWRELKDGSEECTNCLGLCPHEENYNGDIISNFDCEYCPWCGAKMDGDRNYVCETVLT